jgi:hypothetical protein
VMHGHGKSDSAIVAKKLANKAGQPVAEQVERRSEAEGGPAKHAPGTGSDQRVPCAGTHTAGSKGKEEGTVHYASAPRKH